MPRHIGQVREVARHRIMPQASFASTDIGRDLPQHFDDVRDRDPDPLTSAGWTPLPPGAPTHAATRPATASVPAVSAVPPRDDRG